MMVTSPAKVANVKTKPIAVCMMRLSIRLSSV